MFDISWSELLIILIVALVVVGPKDLPRLMRVAGQWVGRARKLAEQFRQSFDEMARQSELDELRKEIAALREKNPLADLNKPIEPSILPPDALPAPEPKIEEPPAEPVSNFEPGDRPPPP
jgi:sec-independent protein translocase protein TatB